MKSEKKKKMAPNAKEKERIEKEIRSRVIPFKKGGIIRIDPRDLKDFNGDPEKMLKYFYKKFLGDDDEDKDDDRDKQKEKSKKGESFSTFKIVTFGEASVRTTSLTIRYISSFFLEDLKPTIGFDFYSKTINYKNKKVKLQIWDYGGQERFRYLLPTYVRNADGALIVYEASDNSSLVHIDDWLMLVRKGNKQVDIPIILVGLVPESDDEREVSSEEGLKIAKSRALDGFIECNIKTGKNVEEIFLALMKLMVFERV